jgi:hypothetical protein
MVASPDCRVKSNRDKVARLSIQLARVDPVCFWKIALGMGNQKTFRVWNVGFVRQTRNSFFVTLLRIVVSGLRRHVKDSFRKLCLRLAESQAPKSRLCAFCLKSSVQYSSRGSGWRRSSSMPRQATSSLHAHHRWSVEGWLDGLLPCRKRDLHDRKVSIHASAREATQRKGLWLFHVIVSIHASAREATSGPRSPPFLWDVSIHASAREATGVRHADVFRCLFQSTPPRGRRQNLLRHVPQFL